MRSGPGVRRPPRRRHAAGATRVGEGVVKRHGLARTLSKSGICSRRQAEGWVKAGRVAVDGRVICDPEFPVVQGRHCLSVDGQPLPVPVRVYLMLNKPRGLITSADDERGRQTVYRCFDGASLPWIAPVGRLDKASEGLLLFSNDSQWAAAITDPLRGPVKTYHVQIDRRVDDSLLASLLRGVDDAGEHLCAASARLLRSGDKNAWLELQLNEGRNRHIRRLLSALDVQVLRLLRVGVGPLVLGDLAKGAWRRLNAEEVSALS